MKESHDIGLLLDSRVPVIVIESYEEKRALDLLLRVANQRKKPIFRWSVTDGLARLSFGPSIAHTDCIEPEKILEHIKRAATPGIYVLCDFHHYLEGEPRNLRLIKDIAQQHYSIPHTIVFLSHQLKIPAELSRYSAVLELSMPSDDEIMSIIREEAKRWGEGRQRVRTDSETLQKLVANLRGLSHSEVRRLARGAIVDDGAITEDDIPAVNKAKFALMDMEGVLSFEYNTSKFSSVAGLERLKRWLHDRREIFCNSSVGSADVPKGILLTGVQGSGKSLAAKSVAGLWGLPLLRLDFASLYNKFFGETERNMREALRLAELMAPCVLWIDEIEKGLSGDQHDSGTSKRILGTLLTWMAERRARVFIVATSNDITGLPPELVRKGRLDEIFFVDLPASDIRREIFRIHLESREFKSENFDLHELTEASDGFSGAEIEQAVVAAIYSAAARGTELSTDGIVEEIRNTSPLSVVMGEKIAALRHWANGRAVNAD